MKGNIAIIAALEGELKPLVTDSTARSWTRVPSSSGTKVWEYRHHDDRWLAVCAGMGAACATLAFEEAERFMPLDAVCSVGWAGSLVHSIRAGSVHCASLVVDADTGEQFRPAHWVAGHPVLVSSSHVADAAQKRRIAARYDAGLVDMEAAAIAQIAFSKSIPFYCFKAVSDDAGDKLPDFDRFIRAGQLRMLQLALNLAVRPWLWASMVRLGWNSGRAARVLSAAIYDWLDERAYIRRSTGDYTEGGRG